MSAILFELLPFATLALAAIWAILLYNNLIRARVRTREAWSGIDVQLKRRSSLIPNLVASVRGYATHEHEVFTEVTQARGALAKASGPAATVAADQTLTQALGRLMVVAEAYPQLQAAGNFSQLQEEWADNSRAVQCRRFLQARYRDKPRKSIPSRGDRAVPAGRTVPAPDREPANCSACR